MSRMRQAKSKNSSNATTGLLREGALSWQVDKTPKNVLEISSIHCVSVSNPDTLSNLSMFICKLKIANKAKRFILRQ